MRMTLQDIAEAVGGQLVVPRVSGAGAPMRAIANSVTIKPLDAKTAANLEATSVTWDSREVEADALYVALPGERVDGHDFVEAAVEAGAVGAFVAHVVEVPVPQIVVDDTSAAFTKLAAYWRGRLHGTVIGLTGSTGKTTTKDLVRDVLACAGSVIATTANQNNELGVPRTLLNAETDTEFVVVEMGMRGTGQIDELCTFVRPDWGVVTNVGMSHLELLGSQDNIARAKAELYAALPEGGIAFLNLDDAFVEQLCEYGKLAERTIRVVGVSAQGVQLDCSDGSDASTARFCSPQTQEKSVSMPEFGIGADFAVAFGCEAKRDEASDPSAQSSCAISQVVFAQDVALDNQGHPSFTLGCIFPNGTVRTAPCTLQLRGIHNVSNACMAAAVGIVAGISVEQCAHALAGAQPAEGRQSFVYAANGALIIDDSYNANPDSMGASLSTFASLQVGGKRIAVLGDMGELGAGALEAHRAVGRMAAKAGLDVLICAGELSRDIAQGAIDAGMPQASVQVVDDATQALKQIKDKLGESDAVLVKASHAMGFKGIVEGLME